MVVLGVGEKCQEPSVRMSRPQSPELAAGTYRGTRRQNVKSLVSRGQEQFVKSLGLRGHPAFLDYALALTPPVHDFAAVPAIDICDDTRNDTNLRT